MRKKKKFRPGKNQFFFKVDFSSFQNFEISDTFQKKDKKETGLTHGSGIHRTLEIDEEFERDVQAERGLAALKTSTEKKHDKRLIVVLENANLELGKFYL